MLKKYESAVTIIGRRPTLPNVYYSLDWRPKEKVCFPVLELDYREIELRVVAALCCPAHLLFPNSLTGSTQPLGTHQP